MKDNTKKIAMFKLVVLACSLTGSLAFAAPFSVTWTDTVGPGSDLPYVQGQQLSVTYVLDNGGTSNLSQSWDASDVVSVTFVINNSSITTVFNPNGTNGLDTQLGTFVTNGAGVLTAVPTDWSDDDSPIVSSNDPQGSSSILWDVNGGQPVYTNESGAPAVAVFATNVSSNRNPSSWTNPGAGGPSPPPTPSGANPVPTMPIYGLALSVVGLLLIAARRLRSAAKAG